MNEREEKLMIGVCKPEDEIAGLINMGLGKAMAALKKMKANGTGLYADQNFTQRITSGLGTSKLKKP